MKVLGFDVETDGFVEPKLSPADPKQPRLVQLGLKLVEGSRTRAAVNLIIHPEGRRIPTMASNVHGITTVLAERHGVPLLLALSCFTHLCKQADVVVGHNVAFDMVAITAAFHQAGRPQSMPRVEPLCTMSLAVPLLDLPPTKKMLAAGFKKPKAPSLAELYYFLFQERIEGAHDAMVDVDATLRCYFEIVRRRPLPMTHDPHEEMRRNMFGLPEAFQPA